MSKLKRISMILKGVLLAYCISFLLILVYSAILTYTGVSESTIPMVVFMISLLSVFLASSLMVIKLKENGLKNGGLIGLIYILVLYSLSSLTSVGFGLSSFSIATIIFNILLGMVGGIIGVNLAK